MIYSQKVMEVESETEDGYWAKLMLSCKAMVHGDAIGIFQLKFLDVGNWPQHATTKKWPVSICFNPF